MTPRRRHRHACLSTCLAATCGDGFIQANVEQCDDANMIDTNACTATCVPAKCGDGFVQAGVEGCDDANMVDTDACLNGCVAAKCGDRVVQAGVEACDDGVNDNAYNGCAVGCAKLGPTCGDKMVDVVGGETCDDGNKVAGDGCNAGYEAGDRLRQPGRRQPAAENGTNMNKFYCYNQGDSVDTRAKKAYESHFGVGACCIISSGYNSLQWGQYSNGGGAGTFHFHPDSWPNGHCAPQYKIGDVVSPDWCRVVTGNFLD